MKFITKLRNRLKKIADLLPNAKPDSDADKRGTEKNSDKTQVLDPKNDVQVSKHKREIDPNKMEIDIQNARNVAIIFSPIVPIKINAINK